jgi:F0F1-type ATP synthase assembly protein I
LKPKKESNEALKYAGMATQMAAAIFIGIWLGKKVDAYFELSKPYFMVLGALFMLCGVFYLIFKQLNRP